MQVTQNCQNKTEQNKIREGTPCAPELAIKLQSSRQCDIVGRPESKNRNRYTDVWLTRLLKHFKEIQQPVCEQLDITGARTLLPTSYHMQRLIQPKYKATPCRAFRRKHQKISPHPHIRQRSLAYITEDTKSKRKRLLSQTEN